MSTLDSYIVIRRGMIAAGVAICCWLTGVGATRADINTSVFTTQEDFTWAQNSSNFQTQPFATPDVDGSSINGIGNPTAAGAQGTAGALGIFLSGTTTFDGIVGPSVQNNTKLLNALGTGGTFQYSYTIPDAGTGNYYELGVLLNYNNHFDTFFRTDASYHQDPNNPNYFTGTVHYTFDPTQIANAQATNSAYFQIGVAWNSNFTPSIPFYFDNLQIIRPLGDFNFDGHVDASDIGVMESALANPDAYEAAHGLTSLVGLGDFNGDGVVNNADLQGFLNYLIAGNGSLSAVPEPASLVLVGLALPAVVMAARRRSRVGN